MNDDCAHRGGPIAIPEKVTTYGGPRDPFVRMIDRMTVVDGTLQIHRQVLARSYAKQLTASVSFTTPKKPSRWMRLFRWIRGRCL